MTTATPDYTAQIIKQVITTWASRNTAVTNFFSKYTDEAAYLNEVAPGRNRAIYLLGHLVSTSDGLLPLFGLGQRNYPELETIFSTSPDKAVDTLPTLPELKEKWENVNKILTTHFNSMSTADWLGKHTSVSEADFAMDPTRNKLNVLMSRTNHQSYHLGQLNLLPVKELVA